jgi:[acyl-carrier-protein] S-malonyltransferase/trans-AT polyketide synthase/acyltransferase/oxidoreductase domain-containing protein
MGRDFHDSSIAARRTFEEAGDAISLDLRTLCFGEDPRLQSTEFAQPAILTVEIAMLRVLGERFDLVPDCYGGHSLGEYTALVAAGVLPLADAVRLVRQRGRLMQEAVPAGSGGMTALVGSPIDRELVARVLAGTRVWIANDNSDSQIVLSGASAALSDAVASILELHRQPLRAVELAVSAPFHSPMMSGIEEYFGQCLRDVLPRIDACRATLVTSNTSGGFHDGDAYALIRALVAQISSPVRWRDNMRAIASRCSRVIEVGPGKPLRPMFLSLEHGPEISSVVAVRSLEQLAA